MSQLRYENIKMKDTPKSVQWEGSNIIKPSLQCVKWFATTATLWSTTCCFSSNCGRFSFYSVVSNFCLVNGWCGMTSPI